MSSIVSIMQIGIDYIGITTPFYCTDGKGNILLHKRSKNCRDEIGTWDPGAGKLEFGIEVEENVLKEVQEEYGVLGKILGSLPAHSVIKVENGIVRHWLAVPFFILVNKDMVINGEPHKIEELTWFSKNSLPANLNYGFAYSYKKFYQEFDKFIFLHK